ncbi:MAG: hypothetical protein ACYC8T_21645 [Myxococcaceae bacterium]
MSGLSPEEQAILERMKKDSAALRRELPRPAAGKKLPEKFTGFAPGLDDQGKPFPVKPVTPAPPKK